MTMVMVAAVEKLQKNTDEEVEKKDTVVDFFAARVEVAAGGAATSAQSGQPLVSHVRLTHALSLHKRPVPCSSDHCTIMR